MRVLIIDDSEDFRLLAAQYLSIEWPAVEIDEYDPLARGAPGADFNWCQYDVLLLDYQLGEADGLTWLREYRGAPGFPPVVFLTGAGSEEVAVQALKLGAADYLRKHDISKARLVDAVSNAMAERRLDAGARRNPDAIERSLSRAAFRTVPSEFHINERGQTRAIRINGYEILHKLGEGGMSSVYLTRRETDGVEVALKILDGRLSDDPAELKRFVREFDIIAKLDTPYVARIFDQGFSDEHIYIAMEYFPGGDLTRLMRRPLKPNIAVCLAATVGRALAAIHAAGIVHRDLKPQNLMMRTNGSVALVDFGISHDSAYTLTLTGQLVGTPAYMSPEQCQGMPADATCDLYSLGCMFYEWVTGHYPYKANSIAEMVFKHIAEPAPQLSSTMAAFQPMLNRLMAKAPAERFQSALELVAYIEQRWQMPPSSVIPWSHSLTAD